MGKLTKTASVIRDLHALVDKEAALAQTDISGKPGVDTKITSVSDETETTDKNSVGPDKLNDKQKYEQKPATDPSTPLASVKTSEDLSKLGESILDSINSKIKEADAQTNISGKPGADTNITSVSDETETTDKNSVGPDKLNDKQKYEQKPATDASTPVANAKKAADASYTLGAQFCEALIKRASEIKYAEEIVNRHEMMKQAGRRDFEAIIANATEQLKQAAINEEVILHKAASAGAAAFDALYKQAEFEAVVEENKVLRSKLAEYSLLEKEAEAKFSEQREQEKFAHIAAAITESIKRELSAAPVK